MRWIDGALTGANPLALGAAGILAASALLLAAPAALAADRIMPERTENTVVNRPQADPESESAAALADGPVHPIEPGRRLPVPPPPGGPTHPIEPKPGKPGR